MQKMSVKVGMRMGQATSLSVKCRLFDMAPVLFEVAGNQDDNNYSSPDCTLLLIIALMKGPKDDV